jgi:hypothetical protein
MRRAVEKEEKYILFLNFSVRFNESTVTFQTSGKRKKAARKE